MSLIAQMEASKINKRRAEADTESEHKILQPATLMRILNEALDAKCLPKKTTKKWSSYRVTTQGRLLAAPEPSWHCDRRNLVEHL